VITTNEAAIRTGFANLASYLHHVRVQAAREAEQAAASTQAERMAARRVQQSGSGTICIVPAQPRLGAE
jgi:hypothetical protein